MEIIATFKASNYKAYLVLLFFVAFSFLIPVSPFWIVLGVILFLLTTQYTYRVYKNRIEIFYFGILKPPFVLTPGRRVVHNILLIPLWVAPSTIYVKDLKDIICGKLPPMFPVVHFYMKKGGNFYLPSLTRAEGREFVKTVMKMRGSESASVQATDFSPQNVKIN